MNPTTDHPSPHEHDDGHGAATLAALVARATGTSPANCYQCGTCAAGCPQNVAGEMDVSPTRVMHLLQLESAFAHDPQTSAEYAARALGGDTPWLCAGCQACTTRCPQGLDIAGTMDVLRQEALARGQASKSKRARDVQALHRTFVRSATRGGRIHELGLVMAYKLRTGHLLQDAALGPAMLRKGKLHLLPGRRPKTDYIRRAIDTLKADHKEGHA